MKTLYIECNMGAAGDMLMGALSELLDDPAAFVEGMNALGLPGIFMERGQARRCGITGTHIHVTVNGQEEHSDDAQFRSPPHAHHHHHEHDPAHDHEHEHGHDHEHEHPHEHGHFHATLKDVKGIIDGLPLSEKVRTDANAVYALIADAESKVHGTPIEHIHFHEVGTLDAIADVVGVCVLMEALAPQKVVVSPVHVGCGQVRCAHGVLPVPAPATALLLQGVPIYGGAVRGELCTPTGAALLRYFADEFGPMPVMTLDKTGCGMGTKEFEWANCVRAMLGQTEEAPQSAVELCCNLDDMTGEEIGFAVRQLREAGALDVWTQPIHMKKDRPGTMLNCLCPPEQERRFAEMMLRHTTTIGVRCRTLRRYTLQRESVTLNTPYGPVRGKRSHGFGVERVKPEFDDVAELALREDLPVRKILRDR